MKTPSIFISYRRTDSEGWAGRLSDALRARLGHVRIFRDIEETPPGVDFVEHFTKAVGECDAFLEIIGPGWLNATDASGRRRLDDPKDPTRLEVATALQRNIRVIPVLLEGTAMPKAEDLPEELQGLARRNAYPLSDSRWAEDTRKLAEILREIVGPPPQTRRVVLGAGAVVVVAVTGFILVSRIDTGGRPTTIPNNAPAPRTETGQPARRSAAAAKKKAAAGAETAGGGAATANQPEFAIKSAVCTHIAREQYRVELAGTASGPVQAFLSAASNPNNGIDELMLTQCEGWSRTVAADGPRNQQMCKRGPGEPERTTWRSTNVYRNPTPPPQGCGFVYTMAPGAEQATILSSQCTTLVCQ